MGGMPIWLSTMLLGLGTVFIGLICLIFITKLMSFFCTRFKPKPAAAAPQKAETDGGIADRGAFSAAVAACIAAVMGGSVDGLRIVSIKKVD